MYIKRETLWGIIITALCTGFMATVGWMILEIIDIKNKQAVSEAEDDLRMSITDAFNDIDKRIAVIEALNVRSRPNNDIYNYPPPMPGLNSIVPDQSAEESIQESFDGPRYDLRKND